jgi:hypothetical protein
MDNPNHQKLSEQFGAEIQAAVEDALENHRRLGQSIAIWQDGKVVTLTVEQALTTSANAAAPGLEPKHP